MRVCFRGAAPSGWTMKRPVMRRCTARSDGTGTAAAAAGGSSSSRASLPRRRTALMRVPASRSTGRLRGCRERSRKTSTRSMQQSSTCGRKVRTTVSTSGNSGMIHLTRKDLPRAGQLQQGRKYRRKKRQPVLRTARAAKMTGKRERTGQPAVRSGICSPQRTAAKPIPQARPVRHRPGRCPAGLPAARCGCAPLPGRNLR